MGALGLTISRVTKNAIGTNGMDNNPYQISATNAERSPHGTVARAILRRNASTWVLGGIAIGLAIALFGPFVVMFVTQDTDTYPLKKGFFCMLVGFLVFTAGTICSVIIWAFKKHHQPKPERNEPE